MDVTDLELETRMLGALPIVNVFYERLGIDRLLDSYVAGDTRLRLSPSAALGVVIDKPAGLACPGVRTRGVGR